jgi:hypothetical protein
MLLSDHPVFQTTAKPAFGGQFRALAYGETGSEPTIILPDRIPHGVCQEPSRQGLSSVFHIQRSDSHDGMGKSNNAGGGHRDRRR